MATKDDILGKPLSELKAEEITPDVRDRVNRRMTAQPDEETAQAVKQAQMAVKEAVPLQNTAMAAADSRLKTIDETPAPTNLEMWMKYNGLKKPLSEEEEKELAKRERSGKIISAVADGLSSLANLYFTTKGAPNMYDNDKGMLPAQQKKYDELRKERKENAYKYSTGMLNAMQKDIEQGRADRNYALTLKRLMAQQANKDRDYEETVRHNKATEAAAAGRTKAKEDRDDKYINLQRDKMELQKQTKKWQTIINNARSGKKPIPFEIDGEIYEIPADFIDKSPSKIAELHAMLDEEHRAVGEMDLLGNPKAPSVADMAAAIGAHYADYPEIKDAMRQLAGKAKAKKKSNPMGGSSSGKRPNPMQ